MNDPFKLEQAATAVSTRKSTENRKTPEKPYSICACIPRSSDSPDQICIAAGEQKFEDLLSRKCDEKKGHSRPIVLLPRPAYTL